MNTKKRSLISVATQDDIDQNSQVIYETTTLKEEPSIFVPKLTLNIPSYQTYNPANPLMDPDNKTLSKLFNELDNDFNNLLSFDVDNINNLILIIKEFKQKIKDKYKEEFIIELEKNTQDHNLINKARVAIVNLNKIINFYENLITLSRLRIEMKADAVNEINLKFKLIEERINIENQLKYTKVMIRKLQGNSIYQDSNLIELENNNKTLEKTKRELMQELEDFKNSYSLYYKYINTVNLELFKKDKKSLISLPFDKRVIINKLSKIEIKNSYEINFKDGNLAVIFLNGKNLIFKRNLNTKAIKVNGKVDDLIDSYVLHCGNLLEIGESVILVVNIMNNVELIDLNKFMDQFNVFKITYKEKLFFKKSIIDHIINLSSLNEKILSLESKVEDLRVSNKNIKNAMDGLKEVNIINKLKLDQGYLLAKEIASNLNSLNFINFRLVISDLKRNIVNLSKIFYEKSAQN